MLEAIKPGLNLLIDVECEVVYENKSTQESIKIEFDVNLYKTLFKIPGKRITRCAKNKRPKSKFYPNKRARYEDQVLEGTTANSVSNHVEDDNQAVTLEEDTVNQSTISENATLIFMRRQVAYICRSCMSVCKSVRRSSIFFEIFKTFEKFKNFEKFK